MTVRVGLLHTVPALAASFDRAVGERDPEFAREHLVDAWLLQTAITDGVTQEVADRVAGHVRTLVADGAAAVLVTCSSIGEAVDAAAEHISVPVLRVDRPMAREAVELARAAAADVPGRPGGIAVLATLDATLGPTDRLIRAELPAESADQVLIESRVVPDAAAARAAGDQALHDRLVGDAIANAARTASVIVLAQASMAEAAPAGGVSVPVLTSPAGGVEALARAAR